MRLSNKSTAVKAAILVLVAIGLTVIPNLINPFAVHFLIILFMYATLSLAWNWLGGYAGQISVGHVIFFGVGAYSTAVGNAIFHLNPWLGTFLGILLAVAFSILIGLPTFRLKGHYFVIATLALNEIFFSVFMGWVAVGGGSGLFVPFRRASVFSFQFSNKNAYYFLILLFFIMAIGITVWLQRSKLGYYLRAIKGDSDAAMAIGIDLKLYKQIAMLMSAAMTALVGAFWANYVFFVDPESVFVGSISIKILLITVVGGVGTIAGPIIGSLIIIPLIEGTRILFGGMGTGLDSVIYGILIMAVAVWQPAGIMGFVKHIKRKRSNMQNKTINLRGNNIDGNTES